MAYREASRTDEEFPLGDRFTIKQPIIIKPENTDFFLWGIYMFLFALLIFSAVEAGIFVMYSVGCHLE